MCDAWKKNAFMLFFHEYVQFLLRCKRKQKIQIMFTHPLNLKFKLHYDGFLEKL